MMNNLFSFINTGSDSVRVEYTFRDPDTGNIIIREEILEPKSVASSQNIQAKFGLDKKVKLENAEVIRGGAKFSVMSRGDAFGNAQDILKRSIIIDIETLGKESGSVITQMGAYDLGTGQGRMYVFQPSVIQQTETLDDRGFKNRSSRRISVDPDASFKELKYAEFDSRVVKGDLLNLNQSLDLVRNVPGYSESIERRLLEEDYFQGRYFATEENLRAHLEQKYAIDGEINPESLMRKRALINKEINDLAPIRRFMQSLGSSMQEEDVNLLLRETRGEDSNIRSLFSNFELRTRVDMTDFLTRDMPDLLKGKVTWIANAAFESTQFGAQIDAEAFKAFEAYNEARVSKNLAPIKEKEFFPKFSYGGYEDEFEEINLNRIQNNLDPVISRNPMYGVTEGISTYDSKPFYVTGSEFSAARAKAFETGDFSDLYKTFLKTTKSGDVRDIIDLVRMQQSMLIKEGLLTSTDTPASLSMEIQARVYGVTEAMRLGKSSEEAYQELFKKELHIGIGDVRLSESPVLVEALDQLEALRLVKEGGEAGRVLEAQAAKGEGAYFRAQMYGKIMDILNTDFTVTDASGRETQVDSLQDVLFRKRVADSLNDLALRGSYETREYTSGRSFVKQMKEVGGIAVEQNIPINRNIKTRSDNIADLFEESLSMQDYPSARKETIINELRTRFEPYMDEAGYLTRDGESILRFRSEAKKLTESFGNQIEAIETRFEQHRPQILDRAKQTVTQENVLMKSAKKVGRSVQNQSRRILNSTVQSSSASTPSRSFLAKKMNKYSSSISKFKAGYLGAALTMIGASFIPKAEKQNLLLGSKEDFIQKKAEKFGVSEEDYINALKTRYNAIDGLPEKGLASLLRKSTTDFGSPYQSPRYSMSVLDDHNMRRERERYMAAQFGARHFSSEGDIGFFLKRFVDSAFRREMGFSNNSLPVITSGQPIDHQKYNSLKGNNLTEYIVSDRSSISVEDADTITIRDLDRANPGMSQIKGDAGEMRIRLAGIDAPETAHGERLAQPYAEEAKRIATEMIAKAKDVRIVAQEGNSTYGRQVAMVYADGVNVNLELLKRGAAAYLPYKSKKAPAMYDEKAFEEAQERAYQSKRGMWKESFFQAYKIITEASNQTTTFNTLVNISKVAKNGHLMSMKSMMDQAQEMGIDNNMQLELADLGKTIGSSENPFSPDSGKNSWSEMDLQMYGGVNNSILSILDRQKYEVGNLMRTRGSLTSKDKVKTTKVTRNNIEMTKSVLAENEYKNENLAKENIEKNMQDLKLKRLKKMEAMQQMALGNQFNSPIGHYRM